MDFGGGHRCFGLYRIELILCVPIPYGLRLNTSCELTEFGKGNDMRCRVLL